MILIAGGSTDPNIDALQNALAFRGYSFRRLNTNEHPVLWDMNSDALYASTHEINFNVLLSRADVFSFDFANDIKERQTSYIWHDVLTQCAHNRGIKHLNDGCAFRSVTKMYNFMAAKRHGFDVPETYVTDRIDLANYVDRTKYIVKPVRGGDYATDLDEIEYPFVNGPAFVQEKLNTPDMRIYRIGDTFVAFKLYSQSIDYRVKQDVQIEYVSDEDAYSEFIESYKKLSDELKLEYSCIDLKKGNDEKFYFLEINTAPMFAAFDATCGLQISVALADLLQRHNTDENNAS